MDNRSERWARYRRKHRNEIAEKTRARRDRDRTRRKRTVYRSFMEFFNSEDVRRLRIAGHSEIYRPIYKIVLRGKITIERLTERLPTW